MKIEKFGTGKTYFNITIGVHGDETAPIKGFVLLKKYLESKKITKAFQVILVNEAAVKINQRFVSVDLNRCFPGKVQGCLEEKLALKLLTETSKIKFNFDFHSTPTPISQPYGVISVYSKELKKIMSASGVENWIFDASESFIKFAPGAFAIEVGCESDNKSPQNAFFIMKNILAYFKVIAEKNISNSVSLNIYLIYHFIATSCLTSLDSKIKDFKYVRKGQLIGFLKNKKPLIAREGFYPVLINDKTAIKKAKRIIIEE